MMEVSREPFADSWSRRDIDMAIGVLMVLRRCSERQAFDEIAASVAETGIGLRSICRALVALASGSTAAFDHRPEVVAVWGDLVAGAAPAVQAS